MSLWKYCLLAALVLWGSVGNAQTWNVTPTHPAHAKIKHALDEDTQLEFIESPLTEVVEFLQDLHDLPLKLDRRALDEVGIGSDSPITINLRGISLRSALKLMLKELELTYVVADEVLMITTKEAAEKKTVTQVYTVKPLIQPNTSSDQLARVLQQALQPTQSKKMPARILAFRHLLIVTGTGEDHEKLVDLLQGLKLGLSEKEKAAPAQAARDPFAAAPAKKAPAKKATPKRAPPAKPAVRNVDPFGGGDPFKRPPAKKRQRCRSRSVWIIRRS